MNTIFVSLKPHLKSISAFIVVYYIASWISDSPLLSFVIGVFGISPIILAILTGEKLTRENLSSKVFFSKTIKISVIVAITITASALPAALISLVLTKWAGGIVFAALYAISFRIPAKKMYFAATGKKGCDLQKKDLALVALSILAMSSVEVVTDHLFVLFPLIAPLFLLLSTTVFIVSLALQAALISMRNSDWSAIGKGEGNK